VCPPELYVFCCKEVYSFDSEFKLNALKTRSVYDTGAPHAPNAKWFNRKYIKSLGLKGGDISKMMASSDDVVQLFSKLAEHISRYRSRQVSVICEKTPININWAATFCATFPQCQFIHVVREPVATIQSLVRRGYTLYEATFIWMHQTHVGTAASDMSNYNMVRYEDLLSDPFGKMASLSALLKFPASAAAIEANYKTNTYRFGLPRPHSWSVDATKGEIGTPAAVEFSADERAFIEMAVLRDAFTMEKLTSVAELRKVFGYFVPDLQQTPDTTPIVSDYYQHAKNIGSESSFLVTTDGSAPNYAIATNEILRLRQKLNRLA
jgi:hypothetical protein